MPNWPPPPPPKLCEAADMELTAEGPPKFAVAATFERLILFWLLRPKTLELMGFEAPMAGAPPKLGLAAAAALPPPNGTALPPKPKGTGPLLELDAAAAPPVPELSVPQSTLATNMDEPEADWLAEPWDEDALLCGDFSGLSAALAAAACDPKWY